MKIKKIISAFMVAVIMIVGVGSFFAQAKAKSPWDYSETPTRAIYYTSPVMTGNDVKWVQQALNIVMKSGLEIDGSFGPASKKATKSFQKKYKLEQDGSFGPASRKKMISLLKEKGYTEPKFSSNKYSKVATYYIGDIKYYKAKLKKDSNGVKKNTVVYLDGNYKPVKNKNTLYKLVFTDCVNYGKDQWISISSNYNVVKELNTACQKILSAEFEQKILGSASAAILTKSPKSIIAASADLTKEGYTVMMTGILLEEITDVALSNAKGIKNYCSNGISSYEEACNVEKALINGRTAFLFAGTDCMLGMADDYKTWAKAVGKSLQTHAKAMFNTLVSTYGKGIGDVVELYSSGKEAKDALKKLYDYGKCSKEAKNTFTNLIDDTVETALAKVTKTQNKL